MAQHISGQRRPVVPAGTKLTSHQVNHFNTAKLGQKRLRGECFDEATRAVQTVLILICIAMMMYVVSRPPLS